MSVERSSGSRFAAVRAHIGPVTGRCLRLFERLYYTSRCAIKQAGLILLQSSCKILLRPYRNCLISKCTDAVCLRICRISLDRVSRWKYKLQVDLGYQTLDQCIHPKMANLSQLQALASTPSQQSPPKIGRSVGKRGSGDLGSKSHPFRDPWPTQHTTQPRL